MEKKITMVIKCSGAVLGGGCRGSAPLPEMTYGFLIQLVFCKKMRWFIGVILTSFFSAATLLKKILDPALTFKGRHNH